MTTNKNDPMDIANWSNGMPDYLRGFSERLKCGEPPMMEKMLHLEPIRVYALLNHFISPRPDGILTILAKGMPLDNPVWWDYVLRYENTYLQVARTVKLMEARVLGPAPALEFDPQRFLEDNVSRYSREVDDKINAFEVHSVYVNHYESYKQCMEWTISEIRGLHLDLPLDPMTHVLSSAEVDKLVEGESKFVNESRKFHVLAKSLVLHSAFMVEAFVNNLIRIGAAPPLRVSEPALKLCLRANFREKLRILKAFTIIMESDVDLSSHAAQGALELMELRNKYVHADESSQHNSLGQVRFDGLFPLFPVSGHSPAVDFALRAYHNPDLTKVEKAYKAATGFVDYMSNLLRPQVKHDVLRLMEQKHLGYNESKRVYSSVFNENSFTYFISPK